MKKKTQHKWIIWEGFANAPDWKWNIVLTLCSRLLVPVVRCVCLGYALLWSETIRWYMELGFAAR